METNIVTSAAMEVSPYVMIFAAAKPMIIEWIKSSDLFPSITPEAKERVLAVAVLLSGISGVLTTLISGQIDENVLQDFAHALTNFMATFGLSEVFYRHVYKRFVFKPE